MPEMTETVDKAILNGKQISSPKRVYLLLILAILLTLTVAGFYAYGSYTKNEKARVVNETVIKLEAEGIEIFKTSGVSDDVIPYGSRYMLYIDQETTFELYAFASEKEKNRAVSSISESGDQVRGNGIFAGGATIIDWVDVPHFYSDDKAILLYVGSDAKVTETLERLLGEQFAGGTVVQGGKGNEVVITSDIPESNDIFITGARLDGNNLSIDVTYPGCAEHTFKLYVSPIQAESDSAGIQTILHHDAHDNSCEIGNISTLEFDVSEIYEQFGDFSALNLVDSQGNVTSVQPQD